MPSRPECVHVFFHLCLLQQVLNDDDMRARYDQFGEAGVSGAAAGGSGFEVITQICGTMTHCQQRKQRLSGRC